MGKIFEALEKSKTESKLPNVEINHPNSPIAFQDFLEDRKENFGAYDLHRDLVTILRPNSIEAEQFKILKTNLLFPLSGKRPRVIMITSAVPGEGKSFVTANLAVSIAQSIDEYVLLMDCDLRLPVIHKRFGLGDTPGLSEYLSRGVPISTLLRKTKISKLSILPGGRPPHNPTELLSSELMFKLVQEVREKYSDRYIIMDTAPPQLTAEGSALAKQVDGVILVVRYRSTPRAFVKNLIDTIGREKILGIIINRFDLRASSYYGFGKYDKYSKYYGVHKKDD